MTASSELSRKIARRTVVAAAGGASLAVALTACGGSDETTVKTGDAPEGGSTGGNTGGSPSGDSGGGGGGKEIAKVADIPEGGGKVVGDVVITQPKAGEFKAFSSKCTHQGCAVKDVSDNVINCPCHDSRFDASDGSVKGGPATLPLPPTAITVDGGSIRLA
ncbi:Rieske (2Fe-2S) protein [Streptomyces katsurahamanus]|uniref:Cytochrome bc1 complex Rieske iron-sulfur subunit n=1 Tax=Streptomyces katsurahamanus TaxID=2577098 RepID=A0ABW9NVF4_9ACTN|nr:Rieske (2Fe-2S) protein [Streptomyces katsurahamanus]MQS37272.1 Rieske (2Fe-2S) protein [Streptomyces katsurahamanus]